MPIYFVLFVHNKHFCILGPQVYNNSLIPENIPSKYCKTPKRLVWSTLNRLFDDVGRVNFFCVSSITFHSASRPAIPTAQSNRLSDTKEWYLIIVIYQNSARHVVGIGFIISICILSTAIYFVPVIYIQFVRFVVHCGVWLL